MNVIQQINGSHHLFWLFENVSTMSTDVRATISRFLRVRKPHSYDSIKLLFGLSDLTYKLYCSVNSSVRIMSQLTFQCEPALWDAIHFTAQRRRRYFWSNIPGMYFPPQHAIPDKTSVDLSDFLMPKRIASVCVI